MEFVLIPVVWLVLLTVIDREAAYIYLPVFFGGPVLFFMRMSYWSVLCKEPREITREIAIPSIEGASDWCSERALSLRYRMGWKSGGGFKHFVRGTPGNRSIGDVCRDEIFVTLDNAKPSVVITVRTWTNRTLGSSDPAAQALEEFVNALQESHVKVESTKHVQDADFGLELFALKVIRVGLRHCERAFLAIRNGMGWD